MKTIISLTAGLCLASFAAAQCYIPFPTFIHSNFLADPLNQWEYVSLDGSQSHDGFWFHAQAKTSYVFTTLDEFGAGGTPGQDYQITILDANGSTAPGEYGLAFNDDVNYNRGEADPLLIWSPVTSGSYTLLLTRWDQGGCKTIASNDIVRVGYRGFITSSNKVSVWMGVDGIMADNDYNWMTMDGGTMYNGRPSSLGSFQCLMDARVTAWMEFDETMHDLFLGPGQEIELDPWTKLRVNNQFYSPVQQGSFLGVNAGRIRSADYYEPGKLIILGGPSHTIEAAGQFQFIHLEIWTDLALTGRAVHSFFRNN
jgi:hypothetical protein